MASMYHICVAAFALICLGKTIDFNRESAPNVGRAGDLLSSIMLYFMTTNSMNYDSYFFSPALRAFDTNKIQDHKGSYDTFINFLVSDFKTENHASNFSFNDTETRDQFLSRFLQYLKSSNNVPENVKLAVDHLEQDVKHDDLNDHARGFIKPCPIYITIRTLTFIGELDYGLSDIGVQNLGSVDTIIGFLTRDFEPSVHGEGLNLNEGEVVDIVNTAMFGFAQEGSTNKKSPLILSDGVPAAKKNKEFFQHILPTVPDNVKTAIHVVLPYLQREDATV